jgi:hypothetical protein
MNFADCSIRLQVKEREETPNADPDTGPEKCPNHAYLEQKRAVPYSMPSDVVTGKQPGILLCALRKDLGTIERHVRQELKKGKRYFRPPAFPDGQTDSLEDMGIAIGEIYDEKIIEECLDQG